MVTINANGQGTLNGEVFNDLNGNGTLDGGEPGLAGWTIDLLNRSNAVIATATTDSNGDLLVHRRRRRARTRSPRSLQSGYVQTAPAAPGTYAVTVAAGQTINNLNFGDFQTVTLERRGLQRPQRQRRPRRGETGPRRLDRQPAQQLEQVVATATTDSSGNYSFTGVGPGTYTVQEVAPVGLRPDAPRRRPTASRRRAARTSPA